MNRILNLFRNSSRYMGRDLEGNSFYEYPGFSADRRPKRTVQYKDPSDVWNYIGGGKRLPVQWSMWLSHTRQHPPALEELQRDLERQKRVLVNAALIEVRDMEERQERLRLEQSLKEENARRAQIEQPQSQTTSSGPSPITSMNEKQATGPPKQGSLPAVDESESWSPQTLRRRG